MVDRGVRLLGVVKFFIGQFVTRNDSSGVGILGLVIRSQREGEEILVRWLKNGYRDTYAPAQLRVVCPDCAQIQGHDKEQRERLKKECDICR